MSTGITRGTIKLLNDYNDSCEVKLEYPRKRIFMHIGWCFVRIGCFVMFGRRCTKYN